MNQVVKAKKKKERNKKRKEKNKTKQKVILKLYKTRLQGFTNRIRIQEWRVRAIMEKSTNW